MGERISTHRMSLYSDGSHDDSEIETADSNPFIYFPIYTVPEEVPDGFQQPVEITSNNVKTIKGLGISRFGEVVPPMA